MEQQFGLRLKLYIGNCKRHPLYPDEDPFNNNPEYSEEVQIQQDSCRSTYMAYSCYQGDIDDVVRVLSNTKGIGYSCFVIVLNTDCDCRNKMLRKVLRAVKSNQNLHRKSKLIMATYTKKLKYRRIWTKDMSEVFFQKYFALAKKRSIGFSSGSVLHPKLNKIGNADVKNNPFYKLQKFVIEKKFPTASLDDVNEAAIKNITKNDMNPLKDHICFTSFNEDNIVFMQCFIEGDADREKEVSTLLFQSYRKPMNAVQSTLLKNGRILGYFRIIQTSTSAESYFYGINPSLAIIINNYYFTSLSVREGSEHDVKHIIRELKKDGIPFMIFQDCSRPELLELMKFLRTLDLSSLKRFMLFIMTHGGDGDILHTSDGTINIRNDIIDHIRSNPSLAKVQSLLFVNACRGNIDPEFAAPDDIEAIQPTNASDLPKNIAILYSTPNGFESLRCPDHGSPYLMSLCKHYPKENDFVSLYSKINSDLSEEDSFFGFCSVCEWVSSNPEEGHEIHIRPEQATPVLNIIDTARNKVVSLEAYQKDKDQKIVNSKDNLFYVIGSKRHNKDSPSFENQYLTPTLDAETCSLDDSQLEECREMRK